MICGTAPCEFGGGLDAFRFVVWFAGEAGEFAGVGRENARAPESGERSRFFGECEQCVGIDDHRLVDLVDDVDDELGERCRPAEAGAKCDGSRVG